MMSLASIVKWLFFFCLTIAAPLFLILGIFSFGVNEIYVWYIMHPRSLVFAFGSFICIIMLYILSIPSVFKVFFGRTEEIRRCSVQESIPHHDIIHTHDSGRRHDEIIASALTLALQRQLYQRKETVKKDGNEKETSQVDCSLHLQQLRQIDKLREDKILSDEEFSELKSIIMETIINEFQNKKDK